MKIPFGIRSGKGYSRAVNTGRLVNAYVENAGPDATSAFPIYGTPGLTVFATSGTGPVRGALATDTSLFIVSGMELYQIDSSGDSTSLGTIPGSGRVTMDYNTSQVVVCADDWNYIWDGTSLAKVTDPDFPGASSVAFIDQYFAYSVPNSAQWGVSALADGTSYDALDIATAEGLPDDIVRLVVDSREVWLFGTSSIEVWANTGATDFPFERIPGGLIEVGCMAANSIQKIDNTIFWLDNYGMINRVQSYAKMRVSDHAIEYAIQQLSDPSSVTSFSYAQDGHSFYGISSARWTWVYDISTGRWAERESYNKGRWRVDDVVRAYGKVLGCDFENGNIYELDQSVYDENGDPLRFLIQSPVIHDFPRGHILDKLSFYIETGVGVLSGQGSDPKAMLQYSDDYGSTWSNESHRSIGKTGEYFETVRWNRLGRAPDQGRAFRFSISDPVKRVIISADIDLRAASV